MPIGGQVTLLSTPPPPPPSSELRVYFECIVQGANFSASAMANSDESWEKVMCMMQSWALRNDCISCSVTPGDATCTVNPSGGLRGRTVQADNVKPSDHLPLFFKPKGGGAGSKRWTPPECWHPGSSPRR